MDASRQPSDIGKFIDEVHRAYQEYLSVPTIMIIVFVVIGIALPALEQSDIAWVDRLRAGVRNLVFGEAESTRDILIAAAATLITITSITFTVLLLAVQEAASAMSVQIIDQFLRRPINQIVFGYFVGMSLYSLIVLASIHGTFNPILSAVLAFVFSGFALYLLAALVYVTLTQMRPAIVIHAIRDETLQARERVLPLVARTRRVPGIDGGPRVPVHSRGSGYVINIDLRPVEKALHGRREDLEIVLQVRIGSFVALGDQVAEIRSATAVRHDDLAQAVLRALKLGRTRDLEYDVVNGIEQILNIGWTTVSSAQHSPSAGAHAIHALRDLIAIWAQQGDAPPADGRLPVVYSDDIPAELLRALESLAVAATESRQHQNLALVLRVFGQMFHRLQPGQQRLVEDMIPRILPELEDEVLTTELDAALLALAAALNAAGRGATAEVVRDAHRQARSRFARLPGADGGD